MVTTVLEMNANTMLTHAKVVRRVSCLKQRHLCACFEQHHSSVGKRKSTMGGWNCVYQWDNLVVFIL